MTNYNTSLNLEITRLLKKFAILHYLSNALTILNLKCTYIVVYLTYSTFRLTRKVLQKNKHHYQIFTSKSK